MVVFTLPAFISLMGNSGLTMLAIPNEGKVFAST
jgi:hypothetical protein